VELAGMDQKTGELSLLCVLAAKTAVPLLITG